MAETTEIKITLDKEALATQVRQAVEGPMVEMAWRLRQAADALDGGAWLRDNEEFLQSEYERGRRDALSSPISGSPDE